jgi:hypothetical protein
MVGWWRANGDAKDSSGHGFDGTLQGGMDFTTGISGQAFATGSGRRVYIPDNPAFYLTSLTMAAWVNPSEFGYTILIRGDDRPGLDPYLIGLFKNAFGIQIVDSSGTPASLWAPNSLPMNQWTHVAASLDGASGDMRVYQNGVLVAETNTTIRPFGALDPSATPGLALGNVQSADYPFVGSVEEVLLYSRVLSPDEIQQLARLACAPHAAKATATVVNGFVVGATLTDGGCGYTNIPTVSIQGGGGTGATATAVVSNGVVAGITITNAGVGYTNTPTVYIYSPLGIQISLVKAVKPSFSDLLPGLRYQLQSSPDMKAWTTMGSPFTATNMVMDFPQYLDVDSYTGLFFRLQVAP